MARQIQIRRGTATENNAFTGAIGEVTMDTTNKTLRVHDGETAGGIKVAKDSDVVHKSGEETISGRKTLGNCDITGTTNIFADSSKTSPYGFLRFSAGVLNVGTITATSWTTRLQIDPINNKVTIAGNYDCTASNSVLTTTGITKGQNGYVKLGNGIIIQWGIIKDNEVSGSVSFLTPFSAAPIITGGRYANSIDLNYGFSAHETYFAWTKSVATSWLRWLAIGY